MRWCSVEDWTGWTLQGITSRGLGGIFNSHEYESSTEVYQHDGMRGERREERRGRVTEDMT